VNGRHIFSIQRLIKLTLRRGCGYIDCRVNGVS